MWEREGPGREEGEDFLRGQTAAIPPPTKLLRSRGQPPVQPRDLAHFFQVSGTDAQEEETTPRDDEGLGGCTSLEC